MARVNRFKEACTGNNNLKLASLNIDLNFGWVQSKIINYMRQMAVITPYAEFRFSYIGPTAE